MINYNCKIAIFYFSEWKRKECDAHDVISSCDVTERCVMSPNSNDTSWCVCLLGYEVRDGKCSPSPTTEKALPTTPRPEPKPSSGGWLKNLIFTSFWFTFQGLKVKTFILLEDLLRMRNVLNFIGRSTVHS